VSGLKLPFSSRLIVFLNKYCNKLAYYIIINAPYEGHYVKFERTNDILLV